MEMLDAKKKQDMEVAKVRLDETRQKLSETMSRITKAENDLQEMKVQFDKKSKNLKRIEGTQFLKVTKLNADIRSLESGLQTRQDEEDELRKTNEQLKAELKKCQEEDMNMEAEFQKVLEELEEKITTGYAEIQNMKDAEVMIEVGMAWDKAEEHAPFMEDLLQKKLADDKVEKIELSALDVALRETQKQVNMRAEELKELKVVNANLCNLITEITGH